MPPVQGHDDREQPVTRECDPDQPFSAPAFKTVFDPNGDLTFMRVFSGRMTAGDMVTNMRTTRRERIGRLYRMHAAMREPIESAEAGDIVAAVGLKDTHTGDTLCDENKPITLESVDFPDTVISMSIEPKSKGDREKLGQVLSVLAKEDPTFEYFTDEETQETIIAGMGELHLEVLRHRIIRDFKVQAECGKPRVAYRQTFRKPIKVEAKHVKQTGGHGQFAVARVEFSPLTGTQEVEFEDAIKGGSIPREYIPSVEKGIRAQCKRGAQYAFPFVGFKASLYDGKYHDVDSSDMAFQEAGRLAFRLGADGNSQFLEPMMKIEVLVPEANLGDVPAASVAIPASLHASLLSRLDRLGPAREIAKAAAAFGREFAFDHLAGVMAEWSPAELRAALERLIEAELVLPIGPPPWMAYSFRHVLIQDAAYSTLLRGERRALHGRIAETLSKLFPDAVAMQPEVAAVHFSKAELHEPAVQHWLEAGIRAADRSAFAEAIRHFSEGVRISRLLPDSAARARKELDLQMALGPALMATRGYAAPESLAVFARADELVAKVGSVAERLDVLLGLFNVHYGRAEIARSLQAARAHLALSEKHGCGESRAHCLLAQSYSAMGAFADAKRHFEVALAMFARNPEPAGSWGVMASQHVVTLALSAGVHFALGELKQARAASLAAIDRARAIDHPLSIALAIVTDVLTPNPGDVEGSCARAEEAVRFCARHGLKNFEAWARFAQGAIMTRRGEVARGIELIEAAIAAAEALGSCLFRPTQLATLAGAYGKQGDSRRALELVEEAIAIAERSEERQALAAIQRLRGEILLAIGRHGEGEAALRLARQIAQAQFAVSEARRIDASLARLSSSRRPAFDCARRAPPGPRRWFGALRALFGF